LEEERGLADVEREQKMDVMGKHNNILKEEEIMWRQRSRVHWLKEGDANSSYFHKIANGRRRVNAIPSLQSDDNIFLSIL